MGSGSGNLIVAQTMKEPSVISVRRNSTRPSCRNLTRKKTSGFINSQLKNLDGQFQKKAHSVKTAGQSLLLINIHRKMIETLIPVVIAIVTGTAVLFNKVNHRVTLLDNRVDKFELKIAENYTPKQEFTAAMLRMEDHLIRIEDKMDVLVNKKCN